MRNAAGIAVPVLETERLRLRGHQLDDFAACSAMWADPMVSRKLGRKPFTEEESWTKLLRYIGHWALLGFGYWAVESKATSRYIGELGFADFHRDTEPSIAGIAEIGWALAAEAHGQGLATEALRQVIDWGDRHLGSRRTVCIIHRDNTASVHLARKLGYSIVLRAATDDQPDMLLARDGPLPITGTR